MTSTGNHNGHQKHVKLTKPDLGYFGRNEVALMGTPCGKIKQLAGHLISALSGSNKVSFIDADHKAAALEQEPALNHGAYLAYTDKINFKRLDFIDEPNAFQQRKNLNDCDVVLVNGNHFKAQRQILIVDPKKPLEKKMDRISDPIMVILTPEADGIPGYLAALVNGLPVYRWEQTEAIIKWFSSWVIDRIPAVKGLVLAGGESKRMQQDKGALNYHGQTQRRHLADQLNSLGLDTWVSCREQQLDEMNDELPILTDSFKQLGPLGAILTALQFDPNAAWLCVACDLPLLKKSTLDFLLQNRDHSKIATAFNNPQTDFPEPLITIWEPKCYMVLLQFLSQGYSCPRKVLINSDIAQLQPPDPRELTNVNSPDEYRRVLKELGAN